MHMNNQEVRHDVYTCIFPHQRIQREHAATVLRRARNNEMKCQECKDDDYVNDLHNWNYSDEA